MNRPDVSYYSIPVPRLETERLVLRGPLASDWDALRAFSMDPERMHFIGGAVTRDYDVWRGMTAMVGHWIWNGYGLWTLEDKITGQPAGRVGILDNVEWPEPELAWHLFAGFEGKGLAQEAAMVIRAYAADTLGLDGLISPIDAANTRSRALAERLGATVEREGELLGKPCLIYRHPSLKEAA